MDNIELIEKIKLLSVSNLIEKLSLDENDIKSLLEQIYNTNNKSKLLAMFETIRDISKVSIEDFQQEYAHYFDCGDDEINLMIADKLFLQTKLGYSKAFCIMDKNTLVGVCSLSLSSLDMYLNEELKVSFPCVKLNFLAVDMIFQGKNYAKYLLIHALHKARFISHSAGCLGVYLETEAHSLRLYEEAGFNTLIDEKHSEYIKKVPMWLSMASIKNVLD